MDENSAVTKYSPHDLFGGQWGVGDNDSAALVTDKFNTTGDLADVYSDKVLELFDELVLAIKTFAPNADDVNYEYVDVPPVAFLGMTPPAAPNLTMPTIGTPPSMKGEIQVIEVGSPVKPTDNVINDPAPSLIWEETPYISTLLVALQTSVQDVIVNGGRGLSEEVFTEILDVALATDELEFEKAYLDAENYYADKGYKSPPGAMVSRLNMLQRERTRNRQRIVSELNNKQAELAYQQEIAFTELGLKLEGLTMDQKEALAARAYEYAKDQVKFFYMAVENSIKHYQTQMEAYKTEWQAEETKVRAIASNNKSITDVFIAETEAYRVGITTELGIIEQITKVYVAEMSGFESNVKSEAIKAESLIERYKAQIQESNNKSTISVSNAELSLRAATAQWDATRDAMTSITKVASQITSAALSAVNASASVSSGVSYSSGYNSSKALSQSNSGQESVSVSKNYSYSA